MSEPIPGTTRLDQAPGSGGGAPGNGGRTPAPKLVALTLAEKVAPATTALLVIDVQNDYNHDEGNSARRGNDVSVCQAMVPRLAQFVNAARAAGVTVIHTRNWHRPETDSPAWLDRLARGGRT